jgi:nicotinamidase-related amidase
MLRSLSPPPRDSRPWLLCVDLQREFVAPNRPLFDPDGDAVIVACKSVLAAARRARWPVAHIHTRRPGALFGKSSPFTRPIVGLEPWISEPLYFRAGLSIFSSPEVLALAHGDVGVEFHLIGYSGEGSCLATVFAGHDLGIQLTLVTDAVGYAGERAARRQGLADITAPLCAAVGSKDLIREMEKAHAEGR